MAGITAVTNILYTLFTESVVPSGHKKLRQFFYGWIPKWFFRALRDGIIHEDDCYDVRNFNFNLALLIDENDIDTFINATGFAIEKPELININDPKIIKILSSPLAIRVKKLKMNDAQETFIRYLYMNAHQAEPYFGMPNYNYHLEKLLTFYSALIGSTGNFLSLPPQLVPNGTTIFGNNIHELFGSPLNISRPSYSSALRLEEEHFGSSGSYNAFDPRKIFPLNQLSLLIVNPPYDENICEDAYRLTTGWIKTMPNMVVLFVVPLQCWKSYACNLTLTPDHDGFVDVDDPAMNTGCKNIYRSFCPVTKKEHCKFYNFMEHHYCEVTPIFIMIRSQLNLERYSFTARHCLERWRAISEQV